MIEKPNLFQYQNREKIAFIFHSLHANSRVSRQPKVPQENQEDFHLPKDPGVYQPVLSLIYSISHMFYRKAVVQIVDTYPDTNRSPENIKKFQKKLQEPIDLQAKIKEILISNFIVMTVL